MNRIFASTLCLLCLQPVVSRGELPLVPLPAEIQRSEGECVLPSEIVVVAPQAELWKSHLNVVADLVLRVTHGKHRLIIKNTGDAFVHVRKVSGAVRAKEAYALQVGAEGIAIEASTLKGLCHGTATLLQLVASSKNGNLPRLGIEDEPKLGFRCFMIDMGRNPHSAQLLKETIDLLWLYKVDALQLHLTDDQRFAFPSTKYPKLWDGLITLDEFKELEAYAVERGVTIIPEFEVPGHSGILRGRYPEVFGKNPADLARDEKAFEGILTVLDEMMDVFSSPYIHIGGDEAFGVPEELQRDLINKLHAYLKSKGRETLVWEGPRPGRGENKVNEEVIHINWRMINYSPKRMLEDGYRVVNAAWDPFYLVDHYPRINFTMTSPRHIYETLNPTRFRHVNPGIPTFANPIDVEPSDRLIGVCMPWWEGREENYFSQIVPRLIPFAEASWNPQIERDYAAFARRTKQSETARQNLLYPVSIVTSELAVESDGVFHNEVVVELVSSLANDEAVIHYTVDGTEPTPASPRYESPLQLKKSTIVRAAAFQNQKQIGHGARRKLTAVMPVKNLALGKPVTSSATSGPPFSVQRVTDGGTGNLDFYLGYPAEPKPIEITIDLETVHTVSRIVVHAYTISNSFEKYTVDVSVDGNSFEQVASRIERPDKSQNEVEHRFESRPVRFVRIRSNGNKGYVFDSFSKVVEVQVFE